MKSFKGQRGVAIIVVALSMVAIGGMAQLAIEGGRMIQERDRLADATEAATLAVSIANRSDQAISDELARKYLESYLPNIEIGNVEVIRKEGQEEVDGNQLYYVQYEVDADVQFDKQLGFINNGSSSANDNYKVANDAMARTYMLPSDLDLVFIADFSGSMNNKWNSKSQLSHLKEQVDIISTDLLSSSATNAGYAHRIGFVPYNLRTQEAVGGDRRCVTELEYYDYVTPNGKKSVSYQDIDWYFWMQQSSNTFDNCLDKAANCPGDSKRLHVRAIDDIFDKAASETNRSTANWPDPYDYVDFDSSVANWNVTKTSIGSLHPKSTSSGSNLLSSGMCGGSEDFYTIPLSLDKPSISSMKASGGTAVYQGVIRGAQILAEGRDTLDDPDKLEKYHERAQMLLILSDGKEDPFNDTFSKLVDEGLCTNIRNHFSDHDSPLYIGVIGINFSASGQTGFQNCADEIIDVSNSQDLLDKIQELIQKGAATNGVSRLYDKNS
ncbi:Tad domain-containing protein [Vibrio breoganii]